MTDTTRYFFNRPTIGGSEGTWGADLNENWEKLDAILYGTSFTDGDANTVERIRPDVIKGEWQIDGAAVLASAGQINFLSGVTSNIQTQINAKQASDAGLTSIASLTTEANRMIYTTALDTYAVTTLTSYARTLLDDADASTARGTLGVGDGFQSSNNGGVFDTVAESGVYHSGTSDTDNPGGAANHIFVHSEINSNLAGQLAMDLGTGYIYARAKTSGTWGDWLQAGGAWQLVETVTPAASPSTIETSAFEDGFEYAVFFNGLAWDNSDAASRGLQVEVYKGTSAAYHSSPLSLTSNDANAAAYGWLYILRPMESGTVHSMDSHVVMAAGGPMVGDSLTEGTALRSSANFNFAASEKLTKIRIGRNGEAAFDLTGGNVKVYKRQII